MLTLRNRHDGNVYENLTVSIKLPVPKGDTPFEPPAALCRLTATRCWPEPARPDVRKRTRYDERVIMANKGGRPRKPPGEGLDNVVSFRLNDRDYAVHVGKCQAAGLNESEFYRQHVLNNTTQVIARPSASLEKKKMLYLVNKASNNLNQLAHRANSEHLEGVISEKTYSEILDNLQRMADYFKVVIANVD